jgi:hypothetical protein
VASFAQIFRKLARALQSFGFGIIRNWYEATRFTPTISQLPQ